MEEQPKEIFIQLMSIPTPEPEEEKEDDKPNKEE